MLWQLDGTMDSCVVFPLVTLSFNVIKKNGNWEGFMVEEEGGELTGRCRLERQSSSKRSGG
jgi:hypothetical protein